MAGSSNNIDTGALYFGTVNPTVTGQEVDNDSFIVTSDGTPTGTPISFWKFDEETLTWVQVPSGNSCPAPMTRAALISLRNANGLSKDCDYVITDHVQGRLVAGTTIHLQAVSANELSENVQVNTTYDNEAWRGIYDIDRGLVLELQDNRGNIARGANGNEVRDFDWGNIAYTNVLVDNAILTVTYGATALINNVEIKKLSNVNLTGFTGQLLNSTIDIVSILNLTNANGIWRYFEMKDNSTLNASNYTGGGDNYYNTLAGVSTVNFSNRTTNVTFRQVELFSSSINAGGATATTTINNAFIHGGSAITHAATSTATLSIANSHIGTGSSVIHSSASPTTLTRVRMGGASTIQLLSGSGGNSTIADVDMFGGANINKYGTSTTGNLSLSGGVKLNSSSFIYHQGTGNLSVAQANFDGSSGINVISGNRNYAFTRISMTGVGRANLSGTNAAVTDSIQDLTIDDRGTLTISCSGAANSLLYSRIAGLSGGIQFSGTTGSKTMNRIKCNDGSINMNNSPNAGTFQLWNLSDAGVANISGHPAGTSMSYVDISNRGTLTVNKTGVGAVSDVRITQAGSMSVTGATTGVNRVNIEIGNINISAGSLQNVDKKMGGTLTVNGGNQNNVFHWTNVNKTTTSNNTNRVDHLGVVSTVPIL